VCAQVALQQLSRLIILIIITTISSRISGAAVTQLSRGLALSLESTQR